MKLFDAHCHIYLSQFDADREEVLAHMRTLDMGAIVVGTDYEESVQALALAKMHDFLWASVGLHPNDNQTEEFDMQKYEALARDPKVVAIGECGLDYFRSGGSDEEKVAQKDRLLKQIELAEKVGKPLIIHCRNAHDDMLAILKEKKVSVPVAIHFFTGSGELAQKYLNLGCYLSFPGPITYTDMYDDSIRVAPLDKILSETDSPFAAPVPHRGQRNEPAYVADVVKKIAALKGLDLEEVSAAIVKNAQKVFGLQF
jgi:TatD DNase family protein